MFPKCGRWTCYPCWKTIGQHIFFFLVFAEGGKLLPNISNINCGPGWTKTMFPKKNLEIWQHAYISQEIFVDAERHYVAQHLFSNIVAQRFHPCGPGFTRELCTFFCAKEEIHNLNEKFGSDSLTLEWVQEGT